MTSLRFDHVKLLPERQLGMHTQPTWELSWVISGHGSRTVGNTLTEFRAGEIVLIPPEMPHCWCFDDDGLEIENITVVFPSSLMERVAAVPEFAVLRERLVPSAGAMEIAGRERDRIEALLTEMDSAPEAERVAMLLQILVVASRGSDRNVAGTFSPSPCEKRMRQVEIFVRCNFQRKITVTDVSSHVGMNRTAFCSWFKDTRGVSFVTYLNGFRIDHACYLLDKQTHNIAAVAYECGFGDLPHFTRTFRRAKGCSPREYRRRSTVAP